MTPSIVSVLQEQIARMRAELPPSREVALAITKLEEAIMWLCARSA
jgi:hypothetical protein